MALAKKGTRTIAVDGEVYRCVISAGDEPAFGVVVEHREKPRARHARKRERSQPRAQDCDPLVGTDRAPRLRVLEGLADRVVEKSEVRAVELVPLVGDRERNDDPVL